MQYRKLCPFLPWCSAPLSSLELTLSAPRTVMHLHWRAKYRPLRSYTPVRCSLPRTSPRRRGPLAVPARSTRRALAGTIAEGNFSYPAFGSFPSINFLTQFAISGCSMWKHEISAYREYSRTNSSHKLLTHVYWNMTVQLEDLLHPLLCPKTVCSSSSGPRTSPAEAEAGDGAPIWNQPRVIDPHQRETTFLEPTVSPWRLPSRAVNARTFCCRYQRPLPPHRGRRVSSYRVFILPQVVLSPLCKCDFTPFCDTRFVPKARSTIRTQWQSSSTA